MSSRGDSKSKGKEVCQGFSENTLDDLASDDYDSYVSQQSHGARTQKKWFKKFFDSLDGLSLEQLNEPQRKWHCPACQNVPGASDRYNLLPLIDHARTNGAGARLGQLHTELADVLCKDLQMRSKKKPFIHNDLVSEIIERLPIKSAFRFCGVSSNWATLIAREIAHSWSQAFKNPKLLFSTIGGWRRFHSVSQNLPPHLWDQKKVELRGFEYYTSNYICKTVRGSTIAYQRSGEAAICNPFWGVYRSLPELTGLKRGNTTIFYLGYDEKMGIFKVLCTSSLPRKPMEFRVLSVVGEHCTWTWRRVKGNKKWVSVDYRIKHEAGYSGVFIDSNIYFEAGASALMCFDVIEEEFRMITVPAGVQIRSNSLMKVNNKLGFIDSHTIWIREEETWRRLEYSIPSELPPSQCLGTIAKDRYVFISTNFASKVFHYDASEQLLENIPIETPKYFWYGLGLGIEAFIDYVESPYPETYGSTPKAIEERRLEEKGNISVGVPLLQIQMARYSAGTVDCPGSPKSVRIVVVGEKGTGKSSLIVAAASVSFPLNVPPVLADTKLPLELPVTIVDTSSRPEDRDTVAKELRNADAVVLTYDCDRPETLERLSTYWLPELRRLGVKVPIIVAGCKLDLRDDNNPVSVEQVMSPIMHQFPEIETFIECSALKQLQAQEVFCYAQERVLHPARPLFDQVSHLLKPRCVRALKRIFILCDRDRDGALSEAEFNDFQVKCFRAPLQPSEFEDVKRAVQEKLPEGENERGLTVTGFLFLHAFFIEEGRLENDIRLADGLLPPSLFKRAPDQSVELTDVAIEFLKGMYVLFDEDEDNNLRTEEIEDLFSTAPESPWTEAPYVDAAEKTAVGGLSFDAFLSLWSLMTTLEPALSVELLIYIGFSGDPSSAIRLTRRRRLDRKKQQCERKVFQCFVFGPNNAGKSALLNCFLGRSYADNPGSTADERYAVNMVDESGSAKKTLVMREIPEDRAQGLFSSKESLAACDIALFVYDSSDESSWKRATELLVEAATHGEATGHEVPCLMVSARGDLDSFPISIQESTRVTQDMGIEPPVSISFKLGDFNYLFRKILTAAQHPHLSIPQTEAGKSHKRFNRLINRSLAVSIGAAAVVFGLVAAAIKR